MPIFGGSKRPKLDGLTKDEEKRRDALNPEVLRRAGEGGVAGQGPAAVTVLREKVDEEPSDFLWPCLLGWQLMSMRRFAPAAEAFVEAIKRDGGDVRAHYGAGSAYLEAAEAKLKLGDAAQAEIAPAGVTVDSMYQEALRHFRRAVDLTTEKDERDHLRNAIGVAERAVAKKSGRL